MVFCGRLLMVCLLDGEIAAPRRGSLPSCSRPSRTLRAAGAVARRRAILDRRCARRRVTCAGRDGRMAAIEQKDGAAAGQSCAAAMSGAPGTRRSRHILMDFPRPLPPRCRESWKRKRAAGACRAADCGCVPGVIARAPSATGEAITLVGLAEAAGGGEGCEALVEGGGADAAARAQLGEWQRAVDVGECGRDALVE